MKNIWYQYNNEKLNQDKIKIVSANNEFLYDENGKEYVDLISSWWTNIHGHCNEDIKNAIIYQLGRLDHCMLTDFTNQPAERLAENLIRITKNNFEKVVFSENGSSSVEIAIKIATQYWKNKGNNCRTKILAFDGGYHGDTFAAMSVGKTFGYYDPFKDMLFDVIFAEYPKTWIENQNEKINDDMALENFKDTINNNKNQISCLIIEPIVQGSNSMSFCSSYFLENLTKIAKENDIIIIFDEVMTGFGRTGEFFAYNYISEAPDIICLSKGLTSGTLPLAVTMVNKKIYSEFISDDTSKAFLHGHTYSGNPITCSAANSSIEIFENQNSIKKIKEIEKLYISFCGKLKKDNRIEKLRTIGSIFAFDIKTWLNLSSNEMLEIRKKIINLGLNLRPNKNTIYFIPPYCINLDVLSNSIEKLLSNI